MAFQKVLNGDSLSHEDVSHFESLGEYRLYEKGEHKAIDLINWTVGIHAADADRMYYLVEVKRLIPPGIKPFEDVKAAVISDYQDYLEKMWIEKLKEKHTIKIFSKSKKRAIEQIVVANN